MRKWLTIVLTTVACAGMATAALAETDIGFKGVGASIGFADPEDLGAAFDLGLMAQLGTFAPNVAFDAVFDFWSKSEGIGAYEYSVKDFAFAGRATYRFTVKSNPKIKPFAGGGLGIHFVKFDSPTVSFAGYTFGGGDETKVKIGLDLGGGCGFVASPKIDIVADLWFRVVSDVSQFTIKGGIVYWLGK